MAGGEHVSGGADGRICGQRMHKACPHGTRHSWFLHHLLPLVPLEVVLVVGEVEVVAKVEEVLPLLPPLVGEDEVALPLVPLLPLVHEVEDLLGVEVVAVGVAEDEGAA